jgi:hypothetical protein
LTSSRAFLLVSRQTVLPSSVGESDTGLSGDNQNRGILGVGRYAAQNQPNFAGGNLHLYERGAEFKAQVLSAGRQSLPYLFCDPA